MRGGYVSEFPSASCAGSSSVLAHWRRGGRGRPNLRVILESETDVDLNLFDGSTLLVGRALQGTASLMAGAGRQEASWEGLRVVWSGYFGDGTRPGYELSRSEESCISRSTCSCLPRLHTSHRSGRDSGRNRCCLCRPYRRRRACRQHCNCTRRRLRCWCNSERSRRCSTCIRRCRRRLDRYPHNLRRTRSS